MKILIKKNNWLYLWGVLPLLLLLSGFFATTFLAQKAESRLMEACRIYPSNSNSSERAYFTTFRSYFEGARLNESCGVIGISPDTDACRQLGTNCSTLTAGSSGEIVTNCRTILEYWRCNARVVPAEGIDDPIGSRTNPCIRELCSNSNCVEVGSVINIGGVDIPNTPANFLLPRVDTSAPMCSTPPPPAPPKCENETFEGTETCEYKIDRTQIIRPVVTGGPPRLLPEPLSCRTNGTAAPCTYCGDGVQNPEASEQCDEGTNNGQPGSFCSLECKNITPPKPQPKCDDGQVNGTETCDYKVSEIGRVALNLAGSLLNDGVCRDPRIAGTAAPCSYCGDGRQDLAAAEECDEGDANGSPGRCSATCTKPRCGDALINRESETCEFSATAPSAAGCRAVGSPSECTYCGDKKLDTAAGEVCDEGLGINGTAGHCAADCKSITTTEVPPACGDGTINQSSETCDSTVVVPSRPFLTAEACRSATAAFPCTYCGDGVWQQGTGGEVCDQSAAPNLTGCATGEVCNSCSRCERIPVPSCGNNNLEPGEACEKNASPSGCATGTQCNEACQCEAVPNPPPRCGDGILQTGEGCEPAGVGFCNSSCIDTTPEVAIAPPIELARLQGSGRLSCSLNSNAISTPNLLSYFAFIASGLSLIWFRMRKK